MASGAGREECIKEVGKVRRGRRKKRKKKRKEEGGKGYLLWVWL